MKSFEVVKTVETYLLRHGIKDKRELTPARNEELKIILRLLRRQLY